jgi:hypothetical protein
MFPLLTYTLSEVVAHAELAQVHDLSQDLFVEAFPLHSVLTMWSILFYLDYQWRACALTATKTYIFALCAAPNLLRLELERINSRSRSRSTADHIDPAHASDQGRWGHPLHAAVYRHSLDCVKLLLDHGFDANARGIDSTALLETAIWHHCDDMSMIKLLLEHGADANARRENGEDHKDRTTVLHEAIDYKLVEVVRVLVEHGADIHARTAGGLTALQYAMKRCTSDDPIIEYFIERERLDAASGASST